jgi:GTPase SAR1 family protein
MGNTYNFIKAEQKTWLEHSLQYDGQVRETNLKTLDQIRNNINIYVAYTKSKWGNIEYQHWFITDKTHFIEFGSASLDIYKARVTINTNPRDYFCDNKPIKMNDQIRDRIRHVLGMSNYSLALRNCEHVANYIIRNRWISTQMDQDKGLIMKRIKSYLLKDQKKLVNSSPSTIRPHIFNSAQGKKKIYSFLNDHFDVTGFDYYLDSAEDTYNILVVGPTGAGKSHLINLFFNEEICKSEVNLRSVTREIYFVRGRGIVYDINKKDFVTKDIVVADTIGLCDTEWDDAQIINMIKGRINSNYRYIDAVYIVFRADRLIKQYVDNIKKILTWLNYNNTPTTKTTKNTRFWFIGTFADYLTNEKKKELSKQAKEIFCLEKNTRREFIDDSSLQFESLIFTGFPPEEALNTLTKERVKECIEKLSLTRKLPGVDKRIKLPNNYDSCMIL